MPGHTSYNSEPVVANHYQAWMQAHQQAVDAHDAHTAAEQQAMEQYQPSQEY